VRGAHAPTRVTGCTLVSSGPHAAGIPRPPGRTQYVLFAAELDGPVGILLFRVCVLASSELRPTTVMPFAQIVARAFGGRGRASAGRFARRAYAFCRDHWGDLPLAVCAWRNRSLAISVPPDRNTPVSGIAHFDFVLSPSSFSSLQLCSSDAKNWAKLADRASCSCSISCTRAVLTSSCSWCSWDADQRSDRHLCGSFQWYI